LGAAGCGGDGNDSAAVGPPSNAGRASSSSDVCPPAPRDLAAVLRTGARRGDQLRRLFALRSRASFSAKAPEVREGVYFVSGTIGAMVVTWAVNASAWRTGAGLIVAADQQTRAMSPRRWVMSPRQLEERFGINEETDGYARARACANPTRA
jgi:hypothetical protein